MGVPTGRDARRFYRAAAERYGDAEVLHRVGHSTGAVYLAGYAIECIMKALLLSVAPAGDLAGIMQSFRGNQGHNYEWLRGRYRHYGGHVPPAVGLEFATAGTWSTNLRYEPAGVDATSTGDFLAAADAILQWARGRM